MNGERRSVGLSTPAIEEEFVVTRMGRPVARLVKYEPPKTVSRLNFARGKIKIAEDFDSWDDEEAAALEMR